MTQTLTPPQIAERYGVSPEKVIGWIRRGELRAVNVADMPTGRPRFRIAESDLLAFEQRRSGAELPAPRRHRKAAGAVIDFF